jgi:hypothetical protein
MIPARAISVPSLRTLEMLRGPNGLFDRDIEPFSMRHAPFRITAATLLAPGVDEALAVLASLAPASTNWLAYPLLDLGDGRGVWRVSGRWIDVAPSTRWDGDPVFERSTETWYATFGLPRMPDGMHRIIAGARTLLDPPSW